MVDEKTIKMAKEKSEEGPNHGNISKPY